MNLEITFSARLVGQGIPRISAPRLHLPALLLQIHTTTPKFYLGERDLNSGPLVHATDNLRIERTPKLWITYSIFSMYTFIIKLSYVKLWIREIRFYTHVASSVGIKMRYRKIRLPRVITHAKWLKLCLWDFKEGKILLMAEVPAGCQSYHPLPEALVWLSRLVLQQPRKHLQFGKVWGNLDTALWSCSTLDLLFPATFCHFL